MLNGNQPLFLQLTAFSDTMYKDDLLDHETPSSGCGMKQADNMFVRRVCEKMGELAEGWKMKTKIM